MRRRIFLATTAGSLGALLFPVGATAEASILANGEFRDGDPVHRGSGKLRISRTAAGARRADLLDMEIVPGPNLLVYLVGNDDPLFPEDVTENFRSLGKLKSLTGDQSYPIPADVDLAAWGSVVVWCDTFKTAFAVATIQRN